MKYAAAVPELPDVMLYLHALEPRVVARRLLRIRIIRPFVLRTFDPPFDVLEGRAVVRLSRIGKRIVLGFDEDLALVIHLMIAGRLRWSDDPAARPAGGRLAQAAFEFETGALTLTEAGTKKRASLHVVRGDAALAAFDRGGLDVLDEAVTTDAFAARLRSERHTLKRTLTDPRLFDGIGNAYSDEILHAAGLSPVALSDRLSDDDVARLHRVARTVLEMWTGRLIAAFGDRFPGAGDVTAFRPDMAVHGRYGQPCPACGATVQRIRYADRETNYCPPCQTGGRVLADRSLSRLLREDWPRTMDELDDMENGP